MLERGGRRGEGKAETKEKKKKLSTFLLATNDMLENKSDLNKLSFIQLGNNRFPNHAPRFASRTELFYQ